LIPNGLREILLMVLYLNPPLVLFSVESANNPGNIQEKKENKCKS